VSNAEKPPRWLSIPAIPNALRPKEFKSPMPPPMTLVLVLAVLVVLSDVVVDASFAFSNDVRLSKRTEGSPMGNPPIGVGSGIRTSGVNTSGVKTSGVNTSGVRMSFKSPRSEDIISVVMVGVMPGGGSRLESVDEVVGNVVDVVVVVVVVVAVR